MAKISRTLLLVVVGLAAAALGTQNSDTVSLHFLMWESRPLPVWVFLLIALAVGIVVGGVSLLVDYVRLQRGVRRERKRADEEKRRADDEKRRADDLARELDALRAAPSGRDEEIATLGDLEPVDAEDDGSTALAPARRRPPGGAFE